MPSFVSESCGHNGGEGTLLLRFIDAPGILNGTTNNPAVDELLRYFADTARMEISISDYSGPAEIQGVLQSVFFGIARGLAMGFPPKCSETSARLSFPGDNNWVSVTLTLPEAGPAHIRYSNYASGKLEWNGIDAQSAVVTVAEAFNWASRSTTEGYFQLIDLGPEAKSDAIPAFFSALGLAVESIWHPGNGPRRLLLQQWPLN